ncbi:MAG TPA: histidinol dehydrogenase [Capsulimonadaceae bacterium]|jgi:histidinol dehydrogenase
MQYFDTERDSRQAVLLALSQRPEAELSAVESTVREILSAIRERGDDAVVEYTRKLDWPGTTAETLELAPQSAPAPPATNAPLAEAADRILAFHRAEMESLQSWRREFGPGRSLGQIIQPVQRVGVYVPGGKAVYPSTVLMAALPAVVAGVKEIIFCSPANSDGVVSPVVLDAMRSVAARGVAIRKFRLGGAVAIGAMAYGTASVPRVDVIVGPGNNYVNIAKRIVYGDVGIDMLAGPSDVAIIADEGANPKFVAADILAQTEHGPENRGVLISPSAALLDAVKQELIAQRATMSRAKILEQSAENLLFVKSRDLIEAVALANALAPEHLELQVRDPETLLPGIRNAGAVLLGDYTSAPVGDYMAGPSHTLPTGGAARFSSPLSVNTFLKRTSVISYTSQAAKEAAPFVARFAEAEGFDAHAAAARLRGE